MVPTPPAPPKPWGTGGATWICRSRSGRSRAAGPCLDRRAAHLKGILSVGVGIASPGGMKTVVNLDHTLVTYPRPDGHPRAHEQVPAQRPVVHLAPRPHLSVPAQPVAPRPTSPSLPALVCDLDDDAECRVAAAQFRKGPGRLAFAAAVVLVVGMLATMRLAQNASPTVAAAARPPTYPSGDSVLERERDLRAARAQAQWVEVPQSPQPQAQPPATATASTAPASTCDPRARIPGAGHACPRATRPAKTR